MASQDMTMPGDPGIGPAPAGPPMCFLCLTDTCRHSAAVKRSDVHGGGLVPAITFKDGTALCFDCAVWVPGG
jgi:hypothetical protein